MNNWILGLALVLITIIQLSAWVMGQDGQVFALTSLVIGGIVGVTGKTVYDNKQ